MSWNMPSLCPNLIISELHVKTNQPKRQKEENKQKEEDIEELA